MTKVKIDELDRHLQTRVGIDKDTVGEYADAISEGAKFPPVKVYDDGKRKYLADGFHRLEAALSIGRDWVLAEIVQGTRTDALRYALGCNNTHGKRLTNADKCNALRIAWKARRDLWPCNDGADPSAELLAEMCGVSKRTAQDFIKKSQPVQFALVGEVQPVQNVQPHEGPQPVQFASVGEPAQTPTRPTRPVLGKDGVVRNMPVMPTRPKRPTKAPARPAAQPATTNRQPRFVDSNGMRHAVPLDRYDVEIPVELQDAFVGPDMLAEVLAKLSAVRCTIRKEQAAHNPQFAAIRQETLMMLDNAYNFVKAAIPHCVCRMCQGNGCKACHGRGWQTEEEYGRNPDEFKAKEAR